MPKNKLILSLGFFIALLPTLGFPHSWEAFFEEAAGLCIVLLSIMISVDKRLMQKAKAERRHVRRHVEAAGTPDTGETGEVVPQVLGRRLSDVTRERRRVVRLGRRATDVNIESVPEAEVPAASPNPESHE